MKSDVVPSRRSSALVAVSLGGVLAVAVCIAVATASSTPNAQAAGPELSSADSERLQTVSTVFAQKQRSADLLPEYMLEQKLSGFVPDSSRLLGSGADGSKYWLAANGEGDVCLVLLDREGWGASTCKSVDVALEKSLSVQLINTERGDGGIRAHLVPRGFEVTDAGDNLELLGDHVLVGAADAKADSTILRSGSGRQIALNELGPATVD